MSRKTKKPIVVGIYKITSPSNKVYIGQSVDIYNRWAHYKRYGSKNQILLHRSFNKYGVENHKFEIIQICEELYLNTFENYWQEYYSAVGINGLNLKITSFNDLSGYLSEQTRLKISKAHKGKKLSEDHKKKLSIAFTGERNHFYGKTHSKQAVKKMSLSSKNRVYTEETRKKMSESQKGRKHSEETKKKISSKNKGLKRSKEQIERHRQMLIEKGAFKGQNNPFYGISRAGESNPMYGKSHKEETKQKISKKNKGKIHTKESKEKMSKQRTGGLNVRAKIVLNTETGIYYDCGKDVALLLNKPYSTVRCWLNGTNPNPTSFIYV